jgi:abortive infection bacteriophage resistance protein
MVVMVYEKSPKSIDEQVELLQQRGMGGDAESIARRLTVVNYYRLSGYWYPFREVDDSFRIGTHIDEIWYRYMFDRRLRLLLLDAIERVEVSIRTKIAYQHSMKYGPFGYATNPSSLLSSVDSTTREALLSRMHDETKRSREEFMEHFRTKYGDEHSLPPLWIAAEVMSMGALVSLFKVCPKDIRDEVAREFGIPEKVFASWLLALNAARNIAAHHGRLWNRELGIKPLIPRPFVQPWWHDPFTISNNRVFALLSICRHCLEVIAPNSGWPKRVSSFIEDSRGIPLRAMGMPDHWKEHRLWSIGS